MAPEHTQHKVNKTRVPMQGAPQRVRTCPPSQVRFATPPNIGLVKGKHLQAYKGDSGREGNPSLGQDPLDDIYTAVVPGLAQTCVLVPWTFVGYGPPKHP